MSAAAAASALARRSDAGETRWVIARHEFGGAVRFAIVWGVVNGLFVISTVKAYAIAYPTAAERVKAAASLQAFSVILGQPYHADSLAGFTQWRVTLVIALIGAIWGLLTSTAMLRGDEDNGRWELLLAAPVTKLRAAGETLAAFGASLAVMFGLTAVVAVASGGLPGARFTAGEALLFAVTLVSGAGMFLAIGSLTSQLSATRGQAAMLGAAVLGVSFLIRMIADGSKGLGWLRWLSPFGWIEEVRPLRDPQPIALVPILALTVGCVIATIAIARTRDLGSSVLREGESSGDGRWLRGPTTLALRLVRGTGTAWVLGVAGFSFFAGYVARSAGELFADSPAFTQVLGRLGIREASEGYLGFTYLQLAVILALIAASQMASTRDEEGSGRLDNLLVRPTARLDWLAGRVAVALGLILVTALAAGAATWVGAESQHVGVALSKLVEAGLNASVPAMFVVGAGVLTLGLRPRAVSAVSYGIVAYSFLVNLVGTLIKGQDWIRDSSLFSHMKLAPAAKPDWGEASWVLLIGLAALVVGAYLFKKRDIEAA